MARTSAALSVAGGRARQTSGCANVNTCGTPSIQAEFVHRVFFNGFILPVLLATDGHCMLTGTNRSNSESVHRIQFPVRANPELPYPAITRDH